MHNIRIRQIPPNGAPNAGPEDYSSFFFMLPYYSVDAIVTAAEAEKKVWKQNFALGTGLGVGLSLVFGVLGGWFLGARWAKRRDAKTSKS